MESDEQRTIPRDMVLDLDLTPPVEGSLLGEPETNFPLTHPQDVGQQSEESYLPTHPNQEANQAEMDENDEDNEQHRNRRPELEREIRNLQSSNHPGRNENTEIFSSTRRRLPSMARSRSTFQQMLQTV